MTWGDVKRSNIKFRLPCQFQRFLYRTLCVFSQITDRKHIEHNFHSVCGGHAPGVGLRGAGGPIDCAFKLHLSHCLL